MKINYNLTGAARKSLVSAVSQELNAPTKYLGMPTAGYEIGEYAIDKTGTLTGPDNRELVAALREAHGITAVEEEYDTPLPETGPIYPAGCMDGWYAPGRVEDDIANEAAAPDFRDVQFTEHEQLGLGRERRENWHGENGMQASDIPEQYTYRAELSDPDAPDRMEVFSAGNDEDALRQAYGYATGEVVLLELHELDEKYDAIRTVDIRRNIDCLAIEFPKDGFTEVSIANLEKLIASKAGMIRTALGVTDLMVKVQNGSVCFPWFKETDIPELDAYTRFLHALCEMAKKLNRVTAKEKPVDNEKYAFRCFLLRLGFIGNEFKAVRKTLLKRLTGNGSFKSGARKPEGAESAIQQEDTDQ